MDLGVADDLQRFDSPPPKIERTVPIERARPAAGVSGGLSLFGLL